jgi:quinoprotein glucose dehydrogenase
MPAFPQLDESKVRSIYSFLTAGGAVTARNASSVESKPKVVSGPVVASGGAPGGQKLRQVVGLAAARQGPNDYGLPYPQGVGASATRYFIPPGWGLGTPYAISPPWSSIIAYDLNKGTVKWKIAVGQDEEAAKVGGKNTGMLRSQRHGMIVTSTGLLFCTSRDGKIYAFDADNGKELWAGKLPTGTQGLPSMYEVNGRHYLVVSATTPVSFGRSEGGNRSAASPPQGGYVVYSLPK